MKIWPESSSWNIYGSRRLPMAEPEDIPSFLAPSLCACVCIKELLTHLPLSVIKFGFMALWAFKSVRIFPSFLLKRCQHPSSLWNKTLATHLWSRSCSLGIVPLGWAAKKWNLGSLNLWASAIFRGHWNFAEFVSFSHLLFLSLPPVIQLGSFVWFLF